MRNLVCKLSALCCDLREQVKMCHQQIGWSLCQALIEAFTVQSHFLLSCLLARFADSRLYEKLPNLFNQIHVDNQEKLKMLIASGDNFPLMDCLSKEKVFSFANSLSGDTHMGINIADQIICSKFYLIDFLFLLAY